MRPATHSRSIFGKWSMAHALLADAGNPLPLVRREVIAVRLGECVHDLRTAPAPAIDAWQDLVDCMNLLQACKDFGWIDDDGGVIPAGAAAILEAHHNYTNHGKLRVSGRSLEALSNMVADACDVLALITARQFWSAIRAAEKHVLNAVRGKRREGDTVVRI